MRRRHRRLRQDADLDITAFMNLMIVLVPVLLLNMVFAHTSILELNFPRSGSSDTPTEASLQLQVVILEDRLLVADNQGGVIREIPATDAGQDYRQLGQVMQAVKARLPEEDEVTVMASRQTPYQSLVTVMDTVRSFDAVVAGNLVEAELFPRISIADAPEVSDAD